MRSRAIVVFIWLTVALFLLGQQQAHPTPTTSETAIEVLWKNLAQALAPFGIKVPEQATMARTMPALELRLAWDRGNPAISVQATPQPRILARFRNGGSVPRLRSLEMGEEKLLVVALDVNSTLRGWTIIQDPRFLRSEAPGPDGVLIGQIVPVLHPEFMIPIPDDPTIIEIRLFQSHSPRESLILEQVAIFPVPPQGGANQ